LKRMTRMNHTEWTDRLSAYIDGDLSTDDRAAMEAHLDTCGPCRRELEGLTDLIARAGALGELEPPRDLWTGIAATIGAGSPVREVGTAKVIALPGAAQADREERPRRRRVTLSRPQLMAASVALIAVSSMVTWMAIDGRATRSGEVVASGVPASGPVAMVGDVPAPPAGLADELSTLEDVLAQARASLDPNTVRILERNLGVIERAIDDSARALAQDPGNEFLSAHLERVYERKLTYLREVAAWAEWAD
jgi:anti-sigma factor RsiW